MDDLRTKLAELADEYEATNPHASTILKMLSVAIDLRLDGWMAFIVGVWASQIQKAAQLMISDFNYEELFRRPNDRTPGSEEL